MKARVLLAGLGIGGAVLFSAAQAQTLSALLDMARNGEPTYQGAQAGVDSARAKQRQALGSFLPQLNLSANTQGNSREYKTRSDNVPEQRDQYNSHGAQLSMNLPLWRYADQVAWRQAGHVLGQSERQLDSAGQELAIKVLSAWFDVLATRDQQAFATQQEKAAQKAWETARRGVELGVVGAPQLEEARAKYDQAQADRAGSEAEAGARLAALEQLTGSLSAPVLPYLRAGLFVPEEEGGTLLDWQQRAEDGNPALRAAQEAYDAATAEVSKQRAGHAPSLDLVSNLSRNSQGAGGFPGQAGYDITQGSIGVQLNVPLYSGGIQSAKVDDAIAQKSKARADLEAARRAAVFAVRQAWAGAQSARFRLKAGQRATEATATALRAARVGERNGLKSDLDVLTAEQNWLAARRDWGRAWYDLMLARSRLKSAAGRFGEAEVAEIEAGFQNDPPRDPAQLSESVRILRADGG